MTVGRIPNIEGGIQPTLLTTTGDIMYASSANNPARLGIGSSAQVLTVASGVPSWATLSSGGMTLLGTTTLTGNSVTISGISGSYNSLFMLILSTTSAAGRWRIAPNASTNITDTSAFSSGSVTSVIDSYMSFPYDTSATIQSSLAVTINNYASTTNHKSFSVCGGLGDKGFGSSGQIKTTSAITSLVISLATVGHTMSGSALLYGVK